jgi:hypothetical protein
VLQERSTSVLPPVPPQPSWSSVAAPAPVADPRPADAGGWQDEPQAWQGAAGPDYYDNRYGGREVEPAHEVLPTSDDYWGRDAPEPDEEVAPREGDPRIGLPMRTGLLGAAALAWVGALAAWPGIAVLVLLGWSVIARATDLSFTSLVLRRYERGRRRSDVAMAVVTSPWHLVVGVVATAVSLILPVGVALAGIFGSALLLAGTRGGQLGPGGPVTLVIGGSLGLAMLWWGPGGASLRRGSRSIVRRLVPAGLSMQIVSGALATVGVVAGAIAIAKGASISWNPFSGNPFGG